MKFTIAIAALFLSSTQAVLLQKGDGSTGEIIPICNGANSNNCTEADEVVKHRLIRPYKKAAEGEPAYASQQAGK